MAYRHKLSCRLALLRDALTVFLAVALAATCEWPSAPASRVAAIVVVPDSLTLDPAQNAKFAAYGRTANGDSAKVAVTWSATGGTVAPDGMYTADTVPGDFLVTAASAQLSLSASSRVHNRGRRPVASVTVSPASASVTVGLTTQLTATPMDANGKPLNGRSVTWVTGNPALATVNGSGLVMGVATGSVTITATSEGQSGASAITVSNVSVASVTVAPATPSIQAGQTVQLTVTLKDASGNPLTGRTIGWATSNTAVATVSGTGLVSGVAAGGATITATSEGKSGSSAITVTAASGGGTVLIQERFEDIAFASRGWYDNTGMAITDTEHIAGSTHALEVHFRVGATNPTWGGSARHLFQATPTLYISYWVKYSDNWVGSGQPYHPHEFLVMSDLDGDYDGPSISWLVAYVEHNYQNGGIPRLALQDSKAINTSFGTPPTNLIGITENRSTSGCNGVVETNVVTSCFSFPPWYNAKELSASRVWFQPTPGLAYKGNWNHVEAYFAINSIVGGIGRADGVAQYWFNGTLVIDRHDILFRTGARPSINFHQFLIAPYIGDGSPVDQYMWVDDLTVATGKP